MSWLEINPYFIGSLLLLQALGNRVFPEVKQRMSIMCLPVTGIVSVIGIWLCGYWILTGDESHSFFTNQLVLLLRDYFLTELVYNAAFHFEHTALLELWIHHIAFLIFLTITLNDQLTGYVRPVLLLEIPTFLRALGTVFPEYRNNNLFRSSFILTRVIWPFYPGFICKSPGFYYYSIPILMQTAHLWWFYKMLMKPTA
jgi:hypothetical protein